MKINNSLLSLYEKAQSIGKDKTSLLEQISAIDLRYLNTHPVGEGGMKKIVKIRDEVTGRNVAMAMIAEENPNDQLIENFLREARISAALQHPNIVPIYDIGLNNKSLPYFTMKLLEGLTLDQFLETNPNITELIDIYKKVCEGIAYAHSKGVIHLDLKPQNIYIGKFGDVIICDWGLARILTTDTDEEIPADDENLDIAERGHLTLNGQVKGTPGFMAPEQANSKSYKNQQTDIFSLGSLLFYMLTKEAPFQGETIEDLCRKTIKEQAVLPIHLEKSIPLSLQAIFKKAMMKEPSLRYTSTNEIITDIDNFQHGFATDAENAGLLRLLILLLKRHKLAFISATVIFLISSISLLMFIKQQKASLYIISGKEKEAREALEKFHQERQEKLQFQRDSSHRYFLNADILFKDLRFNKALQEVDKALLFNPEMRVANALKGKILLSFYRIEEAISYFKKADVHQKGFFRPLTDFCLPRINADTGRLDHNDYLTLVKMTPEPNTVVKFMMEDVFAQKMPLEERLRLVKEILLIRNPEISDLNFSYNDETKGLTLKNNPSLTNIDPVKFLKIKKLDLSNTAITSLERIAKLKLTSLNLSHTYISDLSDIKKIKLNQLNISHTGITNIDELHSMPLTHLNIKGSRITDISVLTKLTGLVEVKADWHKFTKPDKLLQKFTQ